MIRPRRTLSQRFDSEASRSLYKTGPIQLQASVIAHVPRDVCYECSSATMRMSIIIIIIIARGIMQQVRRGGVAPDVYIT